MKEYSFTVKDKNGLHARPAGRLVTVAKGYESEIKVRAQGKEADGKRLLSVMSLGAKQGTELHFEISGADEAQACEALKKHLENGIDENEEKGS